MWAIREEWIDLAQAKHVVIYHNPDVMVPGENGGKPVPVEHHLIHEFGVDKCPHCGHIKEHKPAADSALLVDAPAIDFHKVKADTLEALKNHHQRLMRYREQHPHARIGNGPKA